MCSSSPEAKAAGGSDLQRLEPRFRLRPRVQALLVEQRRATPLGAQQSLNTLQVLGSCLGSKSRPYDTLGAYKDLIRGAS